MEATERAIGEAAAGGGDDGEPAYVFVVSDANLRRYGIPPSALGACTYVIIHKQGEFLISRCLAGPSRLIVDKQPPRASVCNLHCLAGCGG